MLALVNRFFLSIASSKTLKSAGLWMIIIGLIAEAIVIVGVPSGGLEKILSFLFTLMIAAGVWIEHVGAGALEAAHERENEQKLGQIRKLVGARQIDTSPFLKALEGKPKAPVEIIFPKEQGEAFQLSLQLRDLLRAAQWNTTEPKPVPPTDIPRLANQPSHMAAGGQPTGVAVVVRADSQEEFGQVADFNADTPMNVLRAALLQAFGTVHGYAGGADIFPAPPPGVVRIVVGPKP